MPNARVRTDIDCHVGRRIRHRRWLIGMTQIALGEAVGITFQQIQKYETGTNRVPVSRLWEIATAQKTSVGYYFEGLEVSDELAANGRVNDVSELLNSNESRELISLCRAMPPEQRKKLLALAQAISAA